MHVGPALALELIQIPWKSMGMLLWTSTDSDSDLYISLEKERVGLDVFISFLERQGQALTWCKISV